jgi:hypothetical protein
MQPEHNFVCILCFILEIHQLMILELTTRFRKIIISSHRKHVNCIDEHQGFRVSSFDTPRLPREIDTPFVPFHGLSAHHGPYASPGWNYENQRHILETPTHTLHCSARIPNNQWTHTKDFLPT